MPESVTISPMHPYILQILQKKYRRLEDTSKRHDQALRQTKMILKFRDSEIQRLKAKNKDELLPDEKTRDIMVCTVAPIRS